MAKMSRSAVVLGALLLLAGRLEASGVSVFWDRNKEADIIGYTVSWGTQSGVYGSSAYVGQGLTYDVTGLTQGRTYYFVVQAVDADGVTSSYSAESVAALPVPAGNFARAMFDMDGDGKADPVVWRKAALDGADDVGTWYGLLSKSAGSSDALVKWGAAGDVPVAGDYDGDGVMDPAVWQASTGTWFILKSNSGYAEYVSVQWGSQAAGDVPVAGDFDGDGKADIAVWRSSTGTWHVLPSSTDYAYRDCSERQWGARGDVPVPADYDGDGKTDMAVWRPSTGRWYILKSSGDHAHYLSVPWGDQAAGDVPVAGDFDGDGKADIAVWRGSTGTWHVLKSSSGYSHADHLSVQWGDASLGDLAVPADYDGDGKTDISIWRASTGLWYVLKSSDGYSESSYLSWKCGTDGATDTPPAGRLH